MKVINSSGKRKPAIARATVKDGKGRVRVNSVPLEILQPELRRVGARFPQHVGTVHGKGLVAALHVVKPGGIEPDKELATRIVWRCIEKGLMLFAPVGYAGASVKISPPLVIEEDAIREGIGVLEEAMEEVIS